MTNDKMITVPTMLALMNSTVIHTNGRRLMENERVNMLINNLHIVIH